MPRASSATVDSPWSGCRTASVFDTINDGLKGLYEGVLWVQTPRQYVVALVIGALAWRLTASDLAPWHGGDPGLLCLHGAVV
ncbi:MAG: hypothetical protein QM805_11300 [Pseudomonas sp.]